MKLKEYEKLVDKHSKKENKLLNFFISFLFGGIIGVLGELFVVFLEKKFYLPLSEAYMYLMIFLVVFGSILTGTGYFDKVVSFAKAGLIVPTTGFAHTMTSCAMDHAEEGPVKGIGSNIFKMTGCVILYGLVSAFFLALLKGVIK